MRETAKKLFTVDEYYRMSESGILTRDDRVELIQGEILEMSPIGHRHASCVARAVTLFVQAFGSKGVVMGQSPLRLTALSAPQPDVLVLQPTPDFYATRAPVAEDVLLLVEVSESSLRYDVDVKLQVFAAAGIPEIWIENLLDETILIFRNPSGRSYKSSLTVQRGDSISPISFPNTHFAANDLLGTLAR